VLSLYEDNSSFKFCSGIFRQARSADLAVENQIPLRAADSQSGKDNRNYNPRLLAVRTSASESGLSAGYVFCQQNGHGRAVAAGGLA